MIRRTKMKDKNIRVVFLISTLLIFVTLISLAQQGRGRGRIRGAVTDEEGNSLAGAKIIAENLEYGTKFETKSNKKGNWAIGGLASGYFLLGAELEGYLPASVKIQVSQFAQNNPPITVVLKKIFIPEASAPVQDEIDATLLQEGNQLFSEKKYQEAVEKFEGFLEKNPDLYQVHINVGNCYKEMGEYDKAIAAFDVVLEKTREEKNTLDGDEKAAHALAGIGETYIMKGEVETAKSFLQQAIDIFPDDENMSFKIGEIYFKQGEAAKGIEFYDKAIQINSEWAAPYRQRGYAYLNLTNYKMAIESFKNFLELAPNDPQAPNIRNLIPKLEEMIKK